MMNYRSLFFLRIPLVLFALFLQLKMQAQANQNFVYDKMYDENGTIISESKTYFDGLGRTTQTQSRAITDNDVLAAQTVYDAYGRQVMQTLAAPVAQSSIAYKDKFITNTAGTNYTAEDFDRVKPLNGNAYITLGKIENPAPVGSTTAGSLGYYYSTNNAQEPYVPASYYPYSRVEYDNNNLGAVKRRSAPGEDLVMGSGHETQSYTMLSLNELDYLYGKSKSWMISNYSDASANGLGTITAFAITNNRVIKSISVDQNGQEMVSFTSPDGKQLASCLSGQVNGANVITTQLTYTQTGTSSLTVENVSLFIDIHIPQGCENSLILRNAYNINATNITYKILDLKTGFYMPFNGSTEYTGTQPTLPAGYYRITWLRGGENTLFSIKKFAFNITQNVNYYNYTINYYDNAGRLKLVVPPAGVDITYTSPSTSTLPAHKMIGSMNYNSLNQVVSSITPDKGLTEFIYREDGKVRYSKNAKQRASDPSTSLQKFSYNTYDVLGRAIETGEYDPAVSYSVTAITFTTSAVDATLDAARSSQQNYTTYDAGDVSYSTYTDHQTYLLGKVAKTNNASSTTWYSYDELGRTSWTVQQINNMPTSGTSSYFTINYTYDLNGNLKQVAYQKENSAEDFYYYYEYDADQRLKRALTSTDGANKTEQAAYYYYKHGPLKRVELAAKTQGLDYVYTINGWLKSINSPELNERDPGKDGTANSATHTGKDLFGMSLDYYSAGSSNLSSLMTRVNLGDYARATTNIQTYDGGQNQYNGLIKSQRWQTQLPASVSLASPPVQYQNSELLYQYNYDNKYQLTAATFAEVSDAGTMNSAPGKSGGGPLPASSANSYADYKLSGITYDLNGNITTLNRNGYTDFTACAGAPGCAAMDQLTYHYNYTSSRLVNNKLNYVSDAVTSDNYPVNFGLEAGQSTNNYQYDEIGQQTVNDNGTYENETQYDVYGHVIASYYSGSRIVAFLYDEKGQRIEKLEDSSGGLKQTWYVRDVKGNVISTYEKDGSNDMLQTEVGIYADNRIGLYLPQSGTYLYEIDDHLGNVRRTFTKQYKSDISTSFDGCGEDDYLFINNTSIDKTSSDHSHVACGQKASLKVPYDQSIFLVQALPVKQGQIISGTVYSYSSTAPQAKIYILFIPKNVALPWGISNKDISPTTSAWTSNTFSCTATAEGSLYLVAVNNDDNPAHTLLLDDLNIHFSSGGIEIPHQEGSFADYYPHGSIMPGRSYTSADNYRYGYQGQYCETDPETGLDNFEARMYDPLLGRWNVTDPASQFHSAYLAMGNNPLTNTDPDGRRVRLFGEIAGIVGAIASGGLDPTISSSARQKAWTKADPTLPGTMGNQSLAYVIVRPVWNVTLGLTLATVNVVVFVSTVAVFTAVGLGVGLIVTGLNPIGAGVGALVGATSGFVVYGTVVFPEAAKVTYNTWHYASLK